MGSLLRDINCTPNRLAMKLTTTKNVDLSSTIHILPVRYIFFSWSTVQKQEITNVEYYLSKMQTIHVALDRTHFQIPDRVFPFKRVHLFNFNLFVCFFGFFFVFLPFLSYKLFVFAIVRLFSGWAEVAIA